MDFNDAIKAIGVQWGQMSEEEKKEFEIPDDKEIRMRSWKENKNKPVTIKHTFNSGLALNGFVYFA